MRRTIYSGSSKPSSLPMKFAKLLMGLVVLGIILTIAFFMFVYIVILATVFLGYWWWKTRIMRKDFRHASQNYAQQSYATKKGYVIEGEVIRGTGSMPKVLVSDVIAVKTTTERSHGKN